MRDPDRITPTLAAVEKLWRTMPDMRLGQLLWAIADGDPFQIEEDKIVEKIEEMLRKD